MLLTGLCAGIPFFSFSQNQKKSDKYQCTGPGCSVPQHNHKYRQKQVSLSTKNERKAPIRLRHKNINDLRQKTIQVNHDYMNKKVMRIAGIRHQSLNDKPFPLFQARHQDMSRKQQRLMMAAHRSLNGNKPPLFSLRHRDMQSYTQKTLRLRHKDLSSSDPFRGLSRKQIFPGQKSSVKDMDRAGYPLFKLSHKEMSQVCNQRIQLKHRSLSTTCNDPIQVSHKNLSTVCGPRIKMSHKDLQSKCYPSPKVQHKNLSAECMPRYRVKHKDMGNVCYEPVKTKHQDMGNVCYVPAKVKHKDLQQKCYPVMVIKHKSMEGLSCTEYHIRHNDPAKFDIPCDPNMKAPTSTLERIGKEVKYWFTYKRRYCELEARYSGVTEGCVVETSHGTAVVTDVIVKKDLIYPTNIEVAVADVKKGEPTVKLFKIDKTETKEIMIRELIKRQKYVWIVRMYPEERVNLDNLRQLYGDPTYRPPGMPPGTEPPPIKTDEN